MIIQPDAPRKYVRAIALKCSCPAISHSFEGREEWRKRRIRGRRAFRRARGGGKWRARRGHLGERGEGKGREYL